MKRMMLVDPEEVFNLGGRNRGPMPFDEVKAYKKIKKMLAKEEEEKKKNKPKEEGFMKNWSIAKRTAFFALAGPPLGIGYIFGLVILTRQLAIFISAGIH